jgi:hypothetical protein
MPCGDVFAELADLQLKMAERLADRVGGARAVRRRHGADLQRRAPMTPGAKES